MKQNATNSCLKCKGCCKFEEEDLYFAPLFTKQEIKNLNKSYFKLYKNSKNVFQIKLKKQNNIYICPFLGDNHLCEIYEQRPFDCKFWPFMFMKKENKVYLCFTPELCSKTEDLSKQQIKTLTDKAIKYIKDNNIKHLIKTHKELVWNYEDDTLIIEELDLIFTRATRVATAGRRGKQHGVNRNK